MHAVGKRLRLVNTPESEFNNRVGVAVPRGNANIESGATNVRFSPNAAPEWHADENLLPLDTDDEQ